ncbi:MAG TPA: NUDIX hydrolase [Oceanospirillales bacterium]|nr:NUDIX hydrolase [Oceanospirillales bacterium]
MNKNWVPHVTVATIIEKDNKFLMVEEDLHGKKLLNQPAGHLDEGETLVQAAVRETLEESAWHVTIDHLIEFSQWTSPNSNTHFLRACFAGTAIKHNPDQKLDEGIIRALWMSRDEVAQNMHRLRSPLVLHHIDHYIAGKKFDLDFFSYYDKK